MYDPGANPEIESTIERLQDWLRGLDVVILGSGASADYGYPLMDVLAKHLLDIIDPDEMDRDQWLQVSRKLAGGENLEKALEGMTLSESLLNLVSVEAWKLLSSHDELFMDELKNGRDDFALADLIKWLDTAKKKIELITTNYDRVAEYACDFAGITWIDGSGFGYLNRSMRGLGLILRESEKSSQLSTVAKIWKVHGSLDWFSHAETGSFLGTRLSRCVPEHFRPLIIAPGQSKYEQTAFDPFRTILAGSDIVAQNSRVFLCAGYGFNDKHVHQKLIAKSRESQSRFVILARTLTDSTRKFLTDGCKNYIAVEMGQDEASSKIWTPGASEAMPLGRALWSMRGLCETLI